MSEQRPSPRVVEPTAALLGEARVHDWRGLGLDEHIEAARVDARDGCGAAYAAGMAYSDQATTAWAGAALAVYTCLDLAIDRLYERLATPRPEAASLPADLMSRDPVGGAIVCRALRAADPRTGYVFLEDVLAYLASR